MKECRRLQNKMELQVLNQNGQLLVDSREVAEMVEKEHKNLLRDIKGYVNTLDGSNLSSQDFFIESTYINLQNKEQPCYLLTKKGCDMVANKLTGEKGVIFTAKYVTAFEEMKEKLSVKPMPQLSKELQAIFVLDERTVKIESKVNHMENNMPLFNIECKELQGLVRKVGTKVLGGYKSPAYQDNSLRAKIYKDIQGQLKREFGVDKYEAIKRIQLEKAREIVSNYTVPVILQDQIILLNNQMRITEVI